MIRVMVVEDEPHARSRIRGLIAGEPDLELVAEVGDGTTALERIRALRPDLVFLDIQIPEVSGLQVLERLGAAELPYVVFTTAHEEYAIQAFDLSALDYLLKPFDRERFSKAVERARQVMAQGRPPADPAMLAALIEQIRSGTGRADAWRDRRMVVKVGTKVRFIDVDEVECVQAEGDYVAIHVGKESVLVRERLKDFEARLERHGFFRIHRSVLVNMRWVKEMRPFRHGDYEFVLQSGKVFQSSPTYREEVQRLVAHAR
jgi:two-component system LytT family response regulator